ncbi:DNA polymerase III subunit gamma/tau [Bacillus sp. HMF5848]|uniref:DNA polymerase III subunit gamma/tau n=1 Tax=Bacillus sp. HMF5848 TaxID=2495421 RepID=UPI000F77928B|nr:DNA polymerase III subunit gamma/tau [Bacillus sp. HMF5848]RSK25455.1 DNA polymerase III subunit gamma/tau [Bacillus sp. HMF5848]
MAYQALYRAWRPQTFHDVVGQEHVTKTLQNALALGKISHAYLFSGPRGTGKTSAAKIFAKAVNCEQAPITEPCNECSACRGITDGSISDVIEIDAASNNGVEEIRDIRDKVKYAPSAVQYKVYIVDEVHMLSIGAFNALLKTLEEPPKHVIFILATTEPHKIPATIISRCQRFDFKRITSEAIVNRMQYIIDQQDIQVDKDALLAVARAAEGGMRDALSLLDQAISYSEKEVTVEDVLSITGAASQQWLSQLVQALIQKELPVALNLLQDIIANGKDATKLIEDLIFYFRDLLLFKTAPQLEQMLERVTLDPAFEENASLVSMPDIYQLIDVLNKGQQDMKWTNHTRIFLEVAVMKICQLNAAQEQSSSSVDNEHINRLIGRIEELEQQITTIKAQGIAVQTESQAEQKAKRTAPRATGRSSFKVPVGRVNDILSKATRQDLEIIKSRWGDLLETLKNQNRVSHAALLNESEPVAASGTAFVVSFKYEIHCKMAADDEGVRQNIEAILRNLTNKQYEMVGVPEDEWGKIREDFVRSQRGSAQEEEQEEDPLVSEAKKLVGEDFIEIID